MWRRASFYPSIVLLLPCLLTNQLQAEVTINPLPQPLVIDTSGYTARVDEDGCLSSLRVHGQEFLAADVSISRGTYFFHLGPVKQKEVEQPATGTIRASGDLSSIQYSFDDEGMTWELTNHSNVDFVFFTVFADEIDGIRDAGELSKGPINGEESHLTCYRGDARLEIEGFTKVWGPWQGPHQVGQVDLKAGETKQLQLQVGKTSAEEHEALVKLNALPADEAITLLSPRPYQVFQRRNTLQGEVIVSGRCRPDIEQLEIRIRGESLIGPLPERWLTIPLVSPIREFNTKLPITAGGWYSLDVRARINDEVVAAGRVDKFGIGEVFVGAGQSNSTNCGEFQTNQQTGMVSSFSGEHWQLADDPQPGVADSSQGGSFWPTFGDVMYEKTRVPIGVAATGFGGTSVNQWQPDGELFQWMMTRVYQLGPQGFRALLWHQGESDVKMAEDEYYEKLRNVIVASRAKAGWEFPWFIAQASYHNPENLKFDTVRDAQERLWKDAVALTGPDTDTLTGDHRDLNGLGIHFSPKGLKAHGKMWAEQVGGYLQEVLETEQRSP
ncbi:MAG: hypothetical protein KDA57_13245 [Planctomycetales bacterium]|nr:hypothetical protein [Planctomycetales bacterium]